MSGCSYNELPNKLRNSRKGLINIKNDDSKCFLWYHIGHLNPLKTYPERITKADRRMISRLDYSDIKFEDYGRIDKKNSICINVMMKN